MFPEFTIIPSTAWKLEMISDEYSAGLFDGEGHVRVARWEKPNSKHVRYQVISGIGMTYWPVIEQLRATYGGSLNHVRRDLLNPNHRIMFTWHIASQTAASFLRRVLPYLIVKRDEVELALKLQDSIDKYRHQLGHHHKLHPDRDLIFAERRAIADQIYSLKKRSFPALTQ